LVEKEKEKEKEEKAKAKCKKKANDEGQVSAFSTMDQGSQMLARSQSKVKRKATLSQLIEEVITHVTQAFVLIEDDLAKFGDLILNISIASMYCILECLGKSLACLKRCQT